MVSHSPVVRQLIRAHAAVGGSIVAVREVESEDLKRFGIVRFESSAVGSPKSPLPINRPRRETVKRAGTFAYPCFRSL